MTDPLDLVSESVVQLDADGVVVGWNAGSALLYGWSADEAIGRDLDALLNARSSPCAGDVVRTTRKGRCLTIAVRRQWLCDAGDARLIETGRDVTEDRRATADLVRNQGHYRMMFEAMGASFWEVDFSAVGRMIRDLKVRGVSDLAAHLRAHPDVTREMTRQTRVVDVNERSVAMFAGGRDRESMLGSAEPYWPHGSLDAFAETIHATIARQPILAIRAQLGKLDGTTFPALLATCEPNQALRTGVVLIAVLDLSDRVEAENALAESERRYATLFKGMPNALIQSDVRRLDALLADLRASGVTDIAALLQQDVSLRDALMDAVIMVEMNDAARAVSGRYSTQRILGCSARQFRRERPDTFVRMIEARWRGETSFSEETRITMPSGRACDVLYHISFPPEFASLGINLISLTDVSERQAAERAMEEMRAQLAHAANVAVLGEVAATLAHELNQPLAAIAANAAAAGRWLQHQPPDTGRAAPLMARIAADAARASQIIASVRSAATRPAPPIESIAIPDLLRSVSSFLDREIRASHVALTIECESAMPAIHGDRTQLQQLFANLLVNAIQSLEERDRARRAITLACRSLGDHVAVSVTDNGPGFAPGTGPALFSSFFTTRPEGMGMGLAIARSVAERHGGTIAASSDGATGATFTVTLPLPQRATAATPGGGGAARHSPLAAASIT